MQGTRGRLGSDAFLKVHTADADAHGEQGTAVSSSPGLHVARQICTGDMRQPTVAASVPSREASPQQPEDGIRRRRVEHGASPNEPGRREKKQRNNGEENKERGRSRAQSAAGGG